MEIRVYHEGAGNHQGLSRMGIRPGLHTPSHSPYGRVSHRTVFISSLCPIGPLTYTHCFLLKKYQGKIKTDVVSTEAGYDSFCPGEKLLVLLRREGKTAPYEVRSWERNQDAHLRRPLMWGPQGRDLALQGNAAENFHGIPVNERDTVTQRKTDLHLSLTMHGRGISQWELRSVFQERLIQKLNVESPWISIFFLNAITITPLMNIHNINGSYGWAAIMDG